MKLLGLIFCLVFLLSSSCGGDFYSEDASTATDTIDYTKPEYEGQHWHERYVNHKCEMCPECCVEVTEHGFIDEYGVERPLDWLPDEDLESWSRSVAENCNQELEEDLIGDVEYCSDCPGKNCICVMDSDGRWWVDATVGDTEEEDYEDFGDYDDSDWPDPWTPPTTRED